MALPGLDTNAWPERVSEIQQLAAWPFGTAALLVWASRSCHLRSPEPWLSLCLVRRLRRPSLAWTLFSSSRDSITAAWLFAARASLDLPTRERVPTQQLLDHLPNLYDDLMEFLRGGKPTGEANLQR